MLAEKISICEISDNDFYEELCKMPEQRREKISNYRPDDLKLTLAGRILLRKLVYRLYGFEDYVIKYNKNGKPLLDFCFFSISHSGEYAVCTVSCKEIGVDIQEIKDIIKRKKYMLFSESESRFVNESGTPGNAFHTIWTMKEAYIKAVGGVLSDAANINLVSKHNGLITSLGEYDFNTYSFQNYIYTICEKVR